MTPDDYMALAMEEARFAAERGEVPIGAVMVERETGKVIAVAGNETEATNDPTAHAEILAIRRACAAKGSPRIPDCDLYVTLEPCTMCAGAIAGARIAHLYYAAPDEKGGGVAHGAKFFEQPTCHHKKLEIISGLHAEESAQMLRKFFQDRRK